MAKHRYGFKEEVTITSGPTTLEEKILTAFEGEVPSVIYPEIRAITACKVTRNRTYYPYESLIGAKEKGSGVHSLLFPYPIPIIKDHATGGLFGGSSEIYGRAKYGRYVGTENNGYLSVIASITDPDAIQKVLTERYLTVSIGVEADEVFCSICGKNPYEDDDCYENHRKGQTYNINGTPMECFYKIGPVFFHEISFVTVPSDTDARVINKNTQFTEEMNTLEILGGRTKDKKQVILTEYNEDFSNLKRMWNIPVISPVKEAKVEELEAKQRFAETKEEDVILTLGELYGLAEDDPEYSVESKLSAKQRDSMDSSTFCGPGRSFPVNDASHAAAALRMLPRYKGPGDKSKIKACILRKAQQFKKGESVTLGGTALAVLEDKTYGFSLPMFVVNESNITQVKESIDASVLPNKKTIIGALSKFCVDKGIKPTSKHTEDYPVVIELNDQTYPLLYSYVETLEQYVLEVSMDKQEEILQENTPPTETKVEETKEEETPKVEESVKQDESAVTESALLQETTELKEQIDSLNQSLMEMSQAYHVRLAHEAAVLNKILRRQISREKSLVDLTKELVKRSTESLENSLEDLLLDFDGSENVDVQKLEKLENPVLHSDDTKEDNQSTLVVDPSTGHATLETPPQETEVETIYAHYGLSKERLAEAIKRLESKN